MQSQQGFLASAPPLQRQARAVPASEFRLVRYFTLTSLVAFLVVIAVLGFVFRQLSIGGLLRMQEDANVNVTKILANELWASEFGPFVTAMAGRTPGELKAAPQIARLHTKVLAM